jgi:hypothetical protein
MKRIAVPKQQQSEEDRRVNAEEHSVEHDMNGEIGRASCRERVYTSV